MKNAVFFLLLVMLLLSSCQKGKESTEAKVSEAMTEDMIQEAIAAELERLDRVIEMTDMTPFYTE